MITPAAASDCSRSSNAAPTPSAASRIVRRESGGATSPLGGGGGDAAIGGGSTLGNGRGQDEYFTYQLIHGTTGNANGGNHMNHVHIGVGKKTPKI